MKKIKTVVLAVLMAITFSSAQQNHFQIFDTLALLNSKNLKVISFDTIPNFINQESALTQKDYIKLLLHDFIHGIHESSSYEVLDSNSKNDPDIELYFSFKELYVKEGMLSNSDSIITKAKLELKGVFYKNKNEVFNLVSSETSFNNVKDDELLDNMLDVMNEFDSFFDKYSKYQRKKSFQNYDEMSCENLDSLRYLFLRDIENKNENLISNLIMYDFQKISDEEKYEVKKVATSEIDFLVKRENLNFELKTEILPLTLQEKLIKRGLTKLLIFHNLEYRVPLDKTLIKDISYKGHFFEFSIGINMDQADDIICDIYLLDIIANKCLLKTKLYGNNPSDMGDEAFNAIGEMDVKNEIKQCFD